LVRQGESVYFQVWEWEDWRGYVVNPFLVSEEDKNWRTVYHAARYRAVLGDVRPLLRALPHLFDRWLENH
jgi:hypothetical protein